MNATESDSFFDFSELLQLPRPPSLHIACAQIQELAPSALDPSKYNHIQKPYNANITGAIAETKKYVETASFDEAMTHIEEKVHFCINQLVDKKILLISRGIFGHAGDVILRGSTEDGLLGYLSGLAKEGFFVLLAQKALKESQATLEKAPKATDQTTFLQNLMKNHIVLEEYEGSLNRIQNFFDIDKLFIKSWEQVNAEEPIAKLRQDGNFGM